MRGPWLSRSGRLILIFIDCSEAQKKFLAKDTDTTLTVPREGTQAKAPQRPPNVRNGQHGSSQQGTRRRKARGWRNRSRSRQGGHFEEEKATRRVKCRGNGRTGTLGPPGEQGPPDAADCVSWKPKDKRREHSKGSAVKR